MKVFPALLCGAVLFFSVTAFASTAVLAQPVKFPVTINGRRVGESTVQPGTTVEVLGQTGSRVRVKFGAVQPAWVEKTALRDLRVTAAPTQPPPAAALENDAAGESVDTPTPENDEDSPAGQPDADAAPPERETFDIRIDGEKIPFERYGKGKIGVIFFSNSGDMAADIRQSIDPYKKLCASGCSLFLWRYPESGPFAKILPTMRSFLEGSGERLDFSGVASSVVKGIKKETGLEKLLLVGNSLGGGVILWDHAKLARDGNIRFMLISPTEMFMPEVGDFGPMERTALIAHREGDKFIKDPEILSWISEHQSPLTKEARSTSGHIIVGDGLGHEALVSAISAFLELPSR